MAYRQAQRIGNCFKTELRGLAVDRHDALYAVGDSEVKVFDAEGKPLRQWRTAKPTYAVAVAADGAVYIGEEGQVEIFSNDGLFKGSWHDDKLLGLVTSIGFVNGGVLIGDAKDRCIRRYDASGKFLNNIGKDNRMQGFRIPNGIVDFSVDAEGIIHAANPGKHRVERYTPDDRLLSHIGRFDGIDPAGFSGCCNPTNVAVTGADRIYVTEKALPRVKVYDFEGKLIEVIATEKDFDPDCKNMSIAVDSRGRVWVADTVKLAILGFAS